MKNWQIWIIAVIAAVSPVQAELKVRFFADFEASPNGPADNRCMRAGTEVGVLNARIRKDSSVTNGVLRVGTGHYAYQVWIPPQGVPLAEQPSVHLEFIAASSRDEGQWNLLVFKDDNGRNLLSLRFNSWSSIQRWTGNMWAGPIGTSVMRGSPDLPIVLNELDVDFRPEGADIYYNGALIEKSAPYLPQNADRLIRHISLTGPDEASAAWYDNIKVVSWSAE